MPNKQTIENSSLKKDEGKIWIEKDGIIYIELSKRMSEEDVKQLMKEIEEAIRKVLGKAKILINLRTVPTVWTSQFRKRTVERVKEIAKNIRFEKAALFGGNVVLRTIASFIIAATGLGNVKVFPTKEEALKWLKK